jgi:ribose 5-phosphate isomerase B
MIYIASDHTGLKLKKHISDFLFLQKIEFKDLGPQELDPNDDYPDFAIDVCTKVLEDPRVNRGILICKNGVGMVITANRLHGIRATLSWNPQHAQSSRLDDDTNVLCLPAEYINERDALEIVETWLHTDFLNEDRYTRRLQKIENIIRI